jgi:DNA repair exonuclease SbcCD ATPase subunit
MNYTANYKIPLYEGSDPTSYLVTYNETMKKIDESLHALALKVASGEVNDRQFTAEISSIKGRLDTAESAIETIKTELANTNGKISKNSEDISTLQSQLVEQGTSIKNLIARVSALETSFESFKTEQEQKNSAYQNALGDLSAQFSNATKKQDLKNNEFANAIAKNSNNPIYHTCYQANFEAVSSGSQTWNDTHSIDVSKKFTEEEYKNLKFTAIITKQNMTTVKNTCIICGEYTPSGAGFIANRNFDDTFTFSLELKFNSNKMVGFKIGGLATETTAPTPWTINTDITFSVD